jgi:hypothetical protein
VQSVEHQLESEIAHGSLLALLPQTSLRPPWAHLQPFANAKALLPRGRLDGAAAATVAPARGVFCRVARAPRRVARCVARAPGGVACRVGSAPSGVVRRAARAAGGVLGGVVRARGGLVCRRAAERV